jgi:tetratricopeptide (TPR) repeat protein
MELTVDQALQQGIIAHKAGKLDDAERIYRAILQSQPLHPDANHNLGALAISVNKVDVSLPLFKTALEANPKIEQFWFSYINALIKDNKRDVALQVLEDAKKHGITSEKLKVFEGQLITKAQAANSASPSKQQLDNLLNHYQNGRFDEAEKLAVFLTTRFPQYLLSWQVLGALLGQTGRHAEACNAHQTAVALSPLDANSHNNLGGTLKELGRLDEAVASYNQAIALKPDFVEAHNNLGITLQLLDRLDEAEASCRQAIAVKPDFVEAHYNLGNTLKELGKLDEAVASYNQAIAVKPDLAKAHNNLGGTLKLLGRLDEAEASYRQTIALKYDFAEAHCNLGVTLQLLDRLDEAEASYRQTIALKYDFAEAHSNLGEVLLKKGQHQDGLTEKVIGDGVITFNLTRGLSIV